MLCADSAPADAAPSSFSEPVVGVARRWTYLYRALDSEGATIDVMLSPYRDRTAAKHFLQLALWRVGHLRPRVINVDGHAAYPSVIAELKRSGELHNCCQYRRSPYKNNLIEQDHRFLKRRIVAVNGSVPLTARCTPSKATKPCT
jgi:transposase, IS6 family